MGNKNKKWLNYKIAIIAAIAAIIVYLTISVVFGILPLDALSINFIGAALSSLIGALIVLILLRGQTDIEEKRGKDVRILEKKTVVFQDYIKHVWKVWEEQKITIGEFQVLTSKYYQDLMIYLNDERLKTIGDNLSAMGRTIGKDNQESVIELRRSIISIINELSDDLDLGGQIDTEIMEEHDKIVFPLLFKNAILEALNNALPTKIILEKGKYETYMRGKYRFEGFCFEFKQYKGCKMVILGFDGSNKELFLHVNKELHKFDIFRDKAKGDEEKITASFRDLGAPINDKEFAEQDMEKAPILSFSDENSMELYRTEKRNFPNILAKRAAYYFDEIKIEGDNITEFLNRYLETTD